MARMFQIVKKDLYTRKTLMGKEIYPVHVAIPDYKAIHNHTCNMIVSYNDDSIKTLVARVLHSEFNEKWSVDGMEVSVEVIENVQHNQQPQKQVG